MITSTDKTTATGNPMRNSLLPSCIVFFCLFVSGGTALLYELVSARMLEFVLGSSPYAVACTLAVFMGGLGAGALIGGRRSGVNHNPLVIYAALELAVGIYACLMPWLLSGRQLNSIAGWILRDGGVNAVSSAAAAVFSSVVVLALPTMLLGATYPILVGAAERLHKSAGYAGLLYAINTLGAMVATMFGASYFIPAFGLRACLIGAGFLNLLLAAISSMASSSLRGVPGEVQPQPVEAASRKPFSLLLVIAVSAALSMALEVIWTRLFLLVMGSTIYAFSIVLAISLAAIGAGCAVCCSRLVRSPHKALPAVLFCAAAWLYLDLRLAGDLPYLLLSAGQVASRFAHGLTFELAMVSRSLLAALLIFVPAACLGAVFPLCLRMQAAGGKKLPQTAGTLYAVNTVGAVFGSLIAGFVMIPVFGQLFVSGMQISLLTIAAAGLALCLFALPPGSFLNPFMRLCAWLTVCILWIGFLPSWQPQLMTSGVSFYSAAQYAHLTRDKFLYLMGVGRTDADAPQVRFYREGLNTTVSVGYVPATGLIFLKTDGKTEAAVPASGHSGSGSDLATQILLGQLPLLFSTQQPKSVLLVGYGSGTTAGAIAEDPRVDRLVIVELEKAVLQADSCFKAVNGNPLRQQCLSSGRVAVVTADARQMLATEPNKYDLIVSQPSDPAVNGATDLFTRDFWQIAATRLQDGGVFSQWIQLYSISPKYLAVLCRTFQSVFPHTIIFHPADAGEIILIGSRQPIQATPEVLQEHWPEVQQQLHRAGFDSWTDLAQGILMGPDEVRRWCQSHSDQRYNTDDNLLAEYELPKESFDSPDCIQANLNELYRLRIKPEKLAHPL